MTGIILDAILMLLLVAAIGYGIRLERKLTQLRTGQLAFAGAVSELNTAAERAENALASLRMSGEEADMLHDRIIKARALKTELEALVAKGARTPLLPLHWEGPRAEASAGGEVSARTAAISDFPTRTAAPSSLPMKGRESTMPPRPPPASPVLQALAANQAAQQSLNRARRSMDEDLFAA